MRAESAGRAARIPELSVTVVLPAAGVTAVTVVPGAIAAPLTPIVTVTGAAGPRISWFAPVTAAWLVCRLVSELTYWSPSCCRM